jgi:hypothetical protein
MSQKILIGIIAILIIIAVIIVVSFSKSNQKKQETNESVQQKAKEITPATVDESIKSLIEKFKLTCADFLAGDLSGDPDVDCPGFENPVNKNLCYYCFATKNQSSVLCGKIDNDSGFKIVCQRATGSSIDEIMNP